MKFLVTTTMKFNKNSAQYFLWLLLLLLFLACRDNAERHLQLGNWYLQKGLLNEAVLEFKEVPRLLPSNHRELTREQFRLLSKAHYNLALVYTKKGWWDYALKEAEICFDLQPTKDHYELVQLIKRRINTATAASDS